MNREDRKRTKEEGTREPTNKMHISNDHSGPLALNPPPDGQGTWGV